MDNSLNEAVSSWSGFQYQGKVSILETIKQINYLIQNGEELNIPNYKLEIEWVEDFSILSKDKYISIHQVKAYTTGSNTINTYFEAILKLYEKNHNTKYYLHVSNEISNWNKNALEKTVDTKIKNLETKIENLDSAKIDEAQKLNNEIVNLKNIKSISDKILRKVNLYRYENNNFYCHIDDIEGLIKNQLEIYFKQTFQEEKLGTANIHTIYINLIGKLDEHIRDRHLKLGNKYISFTKIKEYLDSDLLFRDENFVVYLIKNNFKYKQKDNFCEQCNINLQQKCDMNQNICNLGKLLAIINDLSLLEFKEFLNKINPHIDINNINEFNIGEYIQNNGIQSLYYIVMMIKKVYQLDNNKIIYNGVEGIYLPTAISNENTFPKL